MTIRDYARRVEAVRALQRRYFSGDRSIIVECKRAERDLDKLTAEVLDDRPSLFGAFVEEEAEA